MHLAFGSFLNLYVQIDLHKYIHTEDLVIQRSDCVGLILPGGLRLWNWVCSLAVQGFLFTWV